MTTPSEHDSDDVILEKKQAALDYLQEAWTEAEADGIEPEIVAHAALFAALSDLVLIYGENAVAEMTASLSKRIEQGEFTVARTVQ